MKWLLVPYLILSSLPLSLYASPPVAKQTQAVVSSKDCQALASKNARNRRRRLMFLAGRQIFPEFSKYRAHQQELAKRADWLSPLTPPEQIYLATRYLKKKDNEAYERLFLGLLGFIMWEVTDVIWHWGGPDKYNVMDILEASIDAFKKCLDEKYNPDLGYAVTTLTARAIQWAASGEIKRQIHKRNSHLSLNKAVDYGLKQRGMGYGVLQDQMASGSSLLPQESDLSGDVGLPIGNYIDNQYAAAVRVSVGKVRRRIQDVGNPMDLMIFDECLYPQGDAEPKSYAEIAKEYEVGRELTRQHAEKMKLQLAWQLLKDGLIMEEEYIALERSLTEKKNAVVRKLSVSQ